MPTGLQVRLGGRISGTHNVLAAKLVNELVEATDELILNKPIARYGRFDLLCLDELGSTTRR
ncbi:hypothetical protein [Nonomuraea sp. NPDC050540]|uniref:hypothetical protein n=1 Tax=Nonomuraea sp. NPDC050540 TaxID=3364367 RepID=UPI00378A585B